MELESNDLTFGKYAKTPMWLSLNESECGSVLLYSMSKLHVTLFSVLRYLNHLPSIAVIIRRIQIFSTVCIYSTIYNEFYNIAMPTVHVITV